MRKRLELLTLTAALCLLLSACGGTDGIRGRYDYAEGPTSASAGAASADYLTLSAGEKGSLCLAGEEFDISWRLDGDRLNVTVGDRAYEGFLSEGVISISFDGLIYTYVKAGTPPQPQSDSGESVKLNALQSWWCGDWYGWWAVRDATGDWAELEGEWYDCCARIELDAAGSGSISMWDGGGPLCTVKLKLTTEDAADRLGAVHSVSGFFWSWKVGGDDWFVDPALSEFEKVFSVESGYYEDESGSFRYDIMLRPWGQLWNDVAEMGGDMPRGYFSWYLPMVESGESMPDTL